MEGNGDVRGVEARLQGGGLTSGVVPIKQCPYGLPGAGAALVEEGSEEERGVAEEEGKGDEQSHAGSHGHIEGFLRYPGEHPQGHRCDEGRH